MLREASSISERAFIAVGLLLSVLYMAGGLWVWLGLGAVGDYSGSLWGLVGLAGGVLILAGIRMQKRSPVLGAFLAIAGAVPLAVILAWTLLPPVLAALMIMLWSRGRIIARRSKETVAAAVAEASNQADVKSASMPEPSMDAS